MSQADSSVCEQNVVSDANHLHVLRYLDPNVFQR